MIRPLTMPQKNMYETEQFFDGTSICNIGGLLFLKINNINIDILEKAVNKVIENSDGIRIKVVEENFKPFQSVFNYEYEKFERISLKSDGYKEIVQSWMEEVFVLI